jgi:hypothetical protein
MISIVETPVVKERIVMTLGLGSGKLAARDIWAGDRLPASDRMKVVLPGHGCTLFAVSSLGQ